MVKPKKNKLLLLLPILALLFASCEKPIDPIDGEEEMRFVRATCTIDLPEADQHGLSIFCAGMVFLQDGMTEFLAPQSDKQQMVVVLDQENNIRMLYRGPIRAGQHVVINSHTTALAIVGSLPWVAMAADTVFDQTISVIEGLSSFPNLEHTVEEYVASGRDLFDTTNNALLVKFQAVVDELMDDAEEDNSTRGSKAGPSPSWVDCDPLYFDWVTDGYYPYSSFTLQNYLLTPTYYGSVTSSNGESRQLVVPTNGSYTILDAGVIFNPGRRYGDKELVLMEIDENNTIELTNWNDIRARTEFTMWVVGDILNFLGCKLPNNVLTNIASAAAPVIASAIPVANGANSNLLANTVYSQIQENIIKTVSKIIEGDAARHFSEDLFLIVGSRLFQWYYAVEGGGNLTIRLVNFFRYPHDISFCIHPKLIDGDVEPQNCLSGDWVDLGLPSGLLWATRNVGASTSTDYGNYYAWGETSPKNSYTWDNYQWGGYDGYGNYIYTKYTGNDGLTTLQPSDDAATANYGGRMPTIGEWQELMNNTTSIWTTINGVIGCRFTGPNGNSLFLPAAGRWRGSNVDDVGSEGSYWSSSLSSVDLDEARDLYFDSNGVDFSSDDGRYRGFSVRAVRQN